MSDLPSTAVIQEVGPRDGLQIEPKILTVEEKLRLIGAMIGSGLREIEVGSFVNPKAVPQMAETEAVLAALPDSWRVRYRALWLNVKGLQRAAASGRVAMDGKLTITASETFIRRNTNRSIDDTIAEMPEWIAAYRAIGVEPSALGVMAAFGCNFEGDVPPENVVGLIRRVEQVMAGHGCSLRHLRLADTMGWANARQTQRLVGMVREAWPDIGIRLHLHDTRGQAVTNAFAAMQLGVREFDAATGGLGGCPFAGNKGAAGNVCTEDLAFMMHECGVDTGIDLEAATETARLAESLVGHPLPGKVMKAGTLAQYRKRG